MEDLKSLLFDLSEKIRKLDKFRHRMNVIVGQCANLAAQAEQGSQMKRIGDVWLPSSDMHFASFILQKNDYQEDTRGKALKFVKNWKVAVDIGGHVGLWTRKFAERFETVHAFEPVPLHRACLARNAFQSNVIIHGYALGNQPHKATISYDSLTNSGETSIRLNPKGDVQIRTLDDLELRNVGLIKIDTQGSEPDILEGAKETIVRCRPIMIVEEDGSIQESKDVATKVRSFLRGVGAKVLQKVRKDIIVGWD